MNRHLGTLRSSAASLVLAAALVGVSSGSTASAAPPDDLVYDALGDSYASGYGVPPHSACGQSQAAYGVQLDARMKIDLDDFVACAGAKTTDITSQLGALDQDTDLVTISVGGNDIGWSDAVKACLGGGDALCQAALGLSTATIIDDLPELLDSVYADIAESAPNAHVVVTGYPRLFSPEYGAFLGASVEEQDALNAGADLLNKVIAEKAAEYGFQFVDVTRRFLDHGVNAPEPWILGPFVQYGSFHPNAAGYEAYTAAVTAAIVPARLR